eukprot:6567967-Heterocapsa_arctica.AAC.1
MGWIQRRPASPGAPSAGPCPGWVGCRACVRPCPLERQQLGQQLAPSVKHLAANANARVYP